MPENNIFHEMNQIKIVSSRKRNFSETYEIRHYKKKNLENLIVVKYRINAKYHHKKNE